MRALPLAIASLGKAIGLQRPRSRGPWLVPLPTVWPLPIREPDTRSLFSTSIGRSNFTYSEVDCIGRGSNKSKRVPWAKNLDRSQVEEQFGVSTFIDQDGWLNQQPLNQIIGHPLQ
ncbi:hypothetical protein CRG98_047590 [Punica granatum]|uniref:Pectinesterase n=1 Tax=Punica granatum TaxID=22663 RepID=A0A2I0HJX1_PUNGR|nr:hypothetical protein CRG98_047590 [Punica granatum]